MPFVRTSRDKRGYEHIYLIDTPIKRGRPSAPRVLYWFRTPPGVKVGREPFDEATRRTLETQYPNLIFDWKKLANTPMPPPDTEHWRERRRLERSARQARAAEEREDEAALAAAAAAVTVNDVTNAELASLDCPETPESAENPGDNATIEIRESFLDDVEVVDLAGQSAAPAAGDAVTAVGPADVVPGPTAPPDARPLEQRRRRRRGGRRRRRTPGAPGSQALQVPHDSSGIAAPSANVADLSSHDTASSDPHGSTLDPHEEE